MLLCANHVRNMTAESMTRLIQFLCFVIYSNVCKSNVAQLQEVNNEIGIVLTILFMLLETLRDDKKLCSDIGKQDLWLGGAKKSLLIHQHVENLDTPLLVFLFGLISQLREKNLKMFPVKKVQ